MYALGLSFSVEVDWGLKLGHPSQHPFCARICECSVTVLLEQVISEVHLLPLQGELCNGELLFMVWPWAFSIFGHLSLPSHPVAVLSLQGHWWSPMWHSWSSFLNMLSKGHFFQLDGKSLSLSSPRSTLGKQQDEQPWAFCPFPHAFMPEYSWYVCQVARLWGWWGNLSFKR